MKIKQYLNIEELTITEPQNVYLEERQCCSNIYLLRDFDCQVLPSASAMVLGNVKSSLDKEAADLDRRRVNMSTGSKLLKEKEHNLRQLETSLLVDEVRISLCVYDTACIMAVCASNKTESKSIWKRSKEWRLFIICINFSRKETKSIIKNGPLKH